MQTSPPHQPARPADAQATPTGPARVRRVIRYRFIRRGTTLRLAEILLVMVVSADACAEPAARTRPVQPLSTPQDRLYFRHLIVRSIHRHVPPRLSAAVTAGRQVEEQRSQLRLLQPAIDGGAPAFIYLDDERRAGKRAFPFGMRAPPGPVNAPLLEATPLAQRPRAAAVPPPDRAAAQALPARAAAAAAQAAASVLRPRVVAAADPVPVIRDPDVLPRRNLNTVKPVAALVPVGPYDATGIAAGPFLYKPALEIQGGYDANPTRRPGGRGSPLGIASAELAVRSQFERHQLNADLRGSYTDVTAQRGLSRPSGEARIWGRYDLTDTTALNGEGRVVSDALVTPGLQTLPRATTYGGSAGVVQKFGPAEINVKGSLDRVTFADARINDMVVLRTGDRNYTQPGAQLRVSYAIAPQLAPFVDVAFDRRTHDMKVDFNGMQRDSSGVAARGGLALNAGRLSGDVSAGWLVRRFDAPAMQNISGWIADATLVWAASDVTNMILIARSQASETPAMNVSGILSRDLIAQLDHQFEPWLVGTLRAGYGQDRFVGTNRTDDRFFVAGGGTWKLSRNVHIKSDLRAEWTRSNLPMTDFMTVVGLLGVRLQY